jgi:uncharacterized membrane protein YphA (DoxX/SURF4 family)
MTSLEQKKPLIYAHWVSRIIVAAIFLMGALPKFTGGAEELAAKLPGGTLATVAIGIAELAAIVLMFIPRFTLIGSILAAIIMLGAVGSHIVGPVGMEGDFATMFVMAIIALLMSIVASVLAFLRRSRGARSTDEVSPNL